MNEIQLIFTINLFKVIISLNFIIQKSLLKEIKPQKVKICITYTE